MEWSKGQDSLFSICISSDSRIICRDFLLPIELVLQLWSSFSKFVLVILSSLYHHFSFSTNLSNSRTKLALSWLCWLGRLVWECWLCNITESSNPWAGIFLHLFRSSFLSFNNGYTLQGAYFAKFIPIYFHMVWCYYKWYFNFWMFTATKEK